MPKKILLADDSVTIQKVVSITLAHEDFDLTIVDNGSKAVSKAKELKPDVILLDVVMPDKDGYQVCQEIKSNADLRNTPIILLTGTFEPFDADRAAEVGADDFIKKPFESHTLINKVKEMAARSGVSRGKPVDISEVDIDFETPIESEYAEKPAGVKAAADEAVVTDDLETPWETDTKPAERPAREPEGEDIWSVEEFDDITGAKDKPRPRQPEAAPPTRGETADRPRTAPSAESPPPAAARKEAASDDFFVKEGGPRDVEAEDFELGEEISEDELEKFLEEETADTEISLDEAPEVDDFGGAEEEIPIAKGSAPSGRAERRPAASFDEEMLVDDFEESPRATAGAGRKPAGDFFEEDTVDEQPIELEWEDEPVADAPAADKSEGEFETLIRRTSEEELADFPRKTRPGAEAGRRPGSREFEVDLSSFEEEPLEGETGGGRAQSPTFDFEELTEEIISDRKAPAGAPAAGGIGRPVEQKDVSIAVDKIARELIEKVVWEVVPELAEELIKQEIKRLKGEKT